MSVKELTLEEGVQEAITRIDAIREKPILVAVYGWNGKSYFIKLLERHFKGKGLHVQGSDGGPHFQEFERLRDNPQEYPELRIFHCGWELADSTELHLFRMEDPNCLAQEISGRKVNLNVGIYNPLISGRPRGE